LYHSIIDHQWHPAKDLSQPRYFLLMVSSRLLPPLLATSCHYARGMHCFDQGIMSAARKSALSSCPEKPFDLWSVHTLCSKGPTSFSFLTLIVSAMV
jgi:hypothetical protein